MKPKTCPAGGGARPLRAGLTRRCRRWSGSPGPGPRPPCCPCRCPLRQRTGSRAPGARRAQAGRRVPDRAHRRRRRRRIRGPSSPWRRPCRCPCRRSTGASARWGAWADRSRSRRFLPSSPRQRCRSSRRRRCHGRPSTRGRRCRCRGRGRCRSRSRSRRGGRCRSRGGSVITLPAVFFSEVTWTQTTRIGLVDESVAVVVLLIAALVRTGDRRFDRCGDDDDHDREQPGEGPKWETASLIGRPGHG